MENRNVRHVVFDVGNVIVRWSPLEIVRLTFGNKIEHESIAREIFQNDIWMDLNKGLMTEEEAKKRYQSEMGFSPDTTNKLFYYVKQSLIPLYGSYELIRRVKQAGYGLYALTDNVHEIVAFLKETKHFWPLFDGEIVSAEVGLLKPQPEIYQALLTRYDLNAAETVFLDDMPHNVKGAQDVGIAAIQFENAEQAETELKQLGLVF
ncbi:HAD family hydrolase [Grimontia sp. AD028]|uniref:HAD family hydrolase n=1 Tax=Grimontia sp. AD028 TaxID=1581149 RepID=UPI00061B36FB|nr:HAD family phosphatase [Grimontia sp. AD028]KKD58657.1 HAD family hydrolase [Grimontia sp. AD028]